MSYKYLLLPGYVVSDDGDRHYVGAVRLTKLYGVNMNECLIKARQHDLRAFSPEFLAKLRVLKPQHDRKEYERIKAEIRRERENGG